MNLTEYYDKNPTDKLIDETKKQILIGQKSNCYECNAEYIIKNPIINICSSCKAYYNRMV